MLEIVIEWLDRVTIVFAFFAMFFSGWNWWNSRKQQKTIEIYIDRGKERSKLPIGLMRRDCTRAEIGGLLGALHCNGIYKIAFLGTRVYFDRLQAVRNGESDQLVIEISPNDDFGWSPRLETAQQSSSSGCSSVTASGEISAP